MRRTGRAFSDVCHVAYHRPSGNRADRHERSGFEIAVSQWQGARGWSRCRARRWSRCRSRAWRWRRSRSWIRENVDDNLVDDLICVGVTQTYGGESYRRC